jgi:hypothetical protein
LINAQMTTHLRHSTRYALALATVLTAAACSDRGKTQAAADSSLARDLSLASSVQQGQATFKDTSLAPTPMLTREEERAAAAPVRARSKPAPEPTVRAPAPRRVVDVPSSQPESAPVAAAAAHKEIGAGTGVALTSGSRICTNLNRPGDKIVATVNTAVTGSNGAVIPAGSAVVLEVSSVNSGSNAEGAEITFRVRSVVIDDHTYDVAADVAPLAALEKTRVAGEDPNADKKKVIGGAIAGAIIGQMMGKNTKSTIIGAAAGAATGAAVAKVGAKWEGCLPEGSPMRLTLNAPIVIS